jgi:hypothetical protein
MRYVLAWLLLAAAIAIGIGRLNWTSYRHMAAHGISGPATVMELLPKIHNSLRYEYQVAGRTFQGQMQSWPPNPALDQLAIGQSLVIYYDPEHPEESVLGDPGPMLRNETISIGLAATLFPTLLVVMWARRAARKHANVTVDASAA